MCASWLNVGSGQLLFGYQRLGEILRVVIPGIRSHDVLFPYSTGPTKSHLLHMPFEGDVLVAEHEDGDGERSVLCRLELRMEFRSWLTRSNRRIKYNERDNPLKRCHLVHSITCPLTSSRHAIGRASHLSMPLSLGSIDIAGFQHSGKSS